MELKQIEAFLKIVEKKSFSAAAEELFISQPTISVRIKQLEKVLNKPLFVRTDGRKIVLTKYAETILPYFEEAMMLIEKGIRLINEDLKYLDKITISCPNHMGVEILPELLRNYYEYFPGVEFDVRILQTKEILEGIRAGKIDIGFGYLDGEDDYDDLNPVQIVEDETILVCSPSHPLLQKKIVSYADLKQERIIVYDREFSTTQKIEAHLKANGLSDYSKMEINNLGWIKMMVRKGLGIAFLQKNIVKGELRNQQLMEVSLEKAPPSIPIYLIFADNVDDDLREVTIKISRSLFET
jgi:DNA-binding transcriptional LysR family regulator